tara:strand:- start:111 stop:581 length:471 start_codon:yes stop_codon:yes gene_type:complete
MSNLVQCPQRGTQIGEWQGYPITARDIAKGTSCRGIKPLNECMIFSEEYVPTRGQKIYSITLIDDCWIDVNRFFDIPDDIVCDLMFAYFEKTAWECLQQLNPGVEKKDAFYHYVINCIPMIVNDIPEGANQQNYVRWNTEQWRQNLIHMDSQGKLV